MICDFDLDQKFSDHSQHRWPTWARTKRLDFGGNTDLEPDPGILKELFAIAILAVLKAPYHGFGSSSKIPRLADLRLNSLN